MWSGKGTIQFGFRNCKNIDLTIYYFLKVFKLISNRINVKISKIQGRRIVGLQVKQSVVNILRQAQIGDINFTVVRWTSTWFLDVLLIFNKLFTFIATCFLFYFAATEQTYFLKGNQVWLTKSALKITAGQQSLTVVEVFVIAKKPCRTVTITANE